MISFDFEYCKPSSIDEAVRLFRQADAAGLEPLYYSGGSEIISMARLNQLRTGAVIDIKSIPECGTLNRQDGKLYIGAAIPLSTLTDKSPFPLLGETVNHVADRTNCNRITVGGNLCGKFIYREAALPFLLADSYAVIAGGESDSASGNDGTPSGAARSVPVYQLFNGTTRLAKGELLVQIVTDESYLTMPYYTVKRTKMEYIDYPIVRICAILAPEGIRAAFSGVSAVPFRSLIIERVLNNTALSPEQRADDAIRIWPHPILNDTLSSAPYRAFVLRNALIDTLMALERKE